MRSRITSVQQPIGTTITVVLCNIGLTILLPKTIACHLPIWPIFKHGQPEQSPCLPFTTLRRLIDITSQRGTAWHCYIGRLLSKGKMLFSTSRPGQTNEYFGTKLDRRDYLGKIYKFIKFGADQLRNAASTWR